jgi:microcystin degradation protein MlrC
VVLCLHGAMVAEGVDDAEGALLVAVRRAVGPGVPIVAVLDFHANITPAMVAAADLLLGYDTYPHIDTAERGQEAAALTLEMLAGGWRPAMALRRLPLLTPLTAQRTDGDTPWRALVDLAHVREAEPGVLGVTLAAGFPYADVPCATTSVVVATRDDRRRADAVADAMAAAIWDRRHEMRDTSAPLAAAVPMALAATGPAIVADGGDNPGAGAPGRDASLLLAFADAGAAGVVAGALHDPAVVARAIDAGVGARIDIDLTTGGRATTVRSVEATVERLGDGVFTNEGPMGRGSVSRLGRTAVLDIGGVRTIFCERVAQTLDPALFRAHGIDPERSRVVVVKSSVHFRAGFAPLAGAIVETDCGGWSSPDLASFPYRRLARPVFPLDPGAAL